MSGKGKPKAFVWKFYQRVKQGKAVKGRCKFCNREYVTHVDRMVKHLLKSCEMCPALVKERLLKNKDYKTKPFSSTSRFVSDHALRIEVSSDEDDIPKEMGVDLQLATCSTVISESSMSDFESSSQQPSCPESSPQQSSGPNPSLPSSSKSNTGKLSLPPEIPTVLKSQSSISGFLDKMNVQEKHELDRMFAKAVYASNLPFHIVENPYVNEFFSKLRPIYRLPGRKQLAGNLLDEAFGEIQRRVNSLVKQTSHFSIVSDGWSNIRNESIINFLVTTPQPLFYKFLCTTENRHTAEYIALQFENVIEELQSEKVFSVVTDNAANMKSAWKIVKEKYSHIQFYSCAAHTMQLFVHDIEGLPAFSSHHDKLRKIVKFFKNKHVPAAVFLRCRKQHCIHSTLSTTSPTRWASTIKHLQQVQVCKKALQTAVVEESVSNICPRDIRSNLLDEDVFWINNSKFSSLLQPVAQAIDKLENDKCTLADVKHEFLNIQQHVIKTCKESPLSSDEESKINDMMEKRIRQLITVAHNGAYLLDPRYQGEKLTSEEFDEACELIMNLTKFKGLSDDQTVLAEVTNFKARSGTFRGKVMWNAVTSIENGQVTSSNWWKGLCPLCPLATVAEILLTLPSSTACAERNWSVWGNIHSKNRNKMKTMTAGKLATVYHNLRLMKNIMNEEEEEYFSSISTDSDSEQRVG